MNISCESLEQGKLCVTLTPESQAERFQIEHIARSAKSSGVGDVTWVDYDGSRGNGVMLKLIHDPFGTK